MADAAKKKGAAYIRKTLVSNERVLYVGKLHNFAYFFPIVLTLFGLILLTLPVIMETRVEGVSTPEQVERLQIEASSRIERAKSYIPEEILPYFDKANQARRLIMGSIFFCFGIMKLTNTIIKKMTVEQAVTNKKVIKKKGMVSVDTYELNLDRIESVKIQQTSFDRIINRGRVLVTGIGMEQIDMRGMKNPAELKKAILETIDLFVNKGR